VVRFQVDPHRGPRRQGGRPPAEWYILGRDQAKYLPARAGLGNRRAGFDGQGFEGGSSRRTWRIGQTKDCRVYYLHYARTMQHRAMQLMARKMTAAMAPDGELSAEGLTAMADDESAAMALARSISNAIDTADIQRNWAKVGSTRKAAASPLLLGLADIEEEPIDGLDILAIEPHLIARTILDCREEDCEMPLSRDVLARMFEDCVSISDEELEALCSA
jgi:hypothetical protein